MDGILNKYFKGELSAEEKRVLFDKIDSDEAYKSEFIRMQNIMALTGVLPQKGDKQWSNRMKDDLDKKLRKKQTYRIIRNVSKYAAIFILVILNVWLFVGRNSEVPETTLYTTIKVPKGQRVNLTLEDGTEVWLSPRSVLKIPNRFDKDQRRVELDGEGFFSVSKDMQRHFIVQTKQHNIQVLGTEFNVFAYSESPQFTTNLIKGQVEVFDRNHPTESILLNPNERVSLVGDRLVKEATAFNGGELLKSGIFGFRNKPFGEILEHLSLWYDVKFDIKQNIQTDFIITGKFKQTDDIESVLKALQDVYFFKYKIVTDEIIEIY